LIGLCVYVWSSCELLQQCEALETSTLHKSEGARRTRSLANWSKQKREVKFASREALSHSPVLLLCVQTRVYASLAHSPRRGFGFVWKRERRWARGVVYRSIVTLVKCAQLLGEIRDRVHS
jgi:hypothetical protein